MIYLIVGPSHAGKTSFVVNSFIKGQEIKEYKDLIPVSECDNCYLIGRYSISERTKGTDRVSRKDIPLFGEQIKRLLDKGKDIVLEGDKICSHNLFDEIKSWGVPCKLYWVKCSPEKSYERNQVHGSVCKFSHLKAVYSKSRNIFNDYKNDFDGEIIDTENITDFTKLDMSCTNSTKKDIPPMRDDFAVFILSHGRADRIKTLDTLRKGNYTGKWYIIIDNEDPTADEYYEKFGEDKVIMFDKLAISKTFDTADTFNDRRTIVYARNACFDIAEQLGIEYFLELDDDYTSLMYRKIKNGQLIGVTCRQLNKMFSLMIDFLEDTGATTVAFAQGGDLIGGANGSKYHQRVLRKAMNSFFCKTKNRFNFIGRVNEDVNTYANLGSKGHLFLTITDFALTQVATQQNAGGMTNVYLNSGTYLKSFYSVMINPSFVTCYRLMTTNSRIHHKLNYDLGVPKIINQKYKK